MKKILIICILILAVLAPAFAVDVPRDSEGYYVWWKPGRNPRVSRGVFSRVEYTAWMLSEGGRNDLLRCGMPKNLVNLSVYLVQKGMFYPDFQQFSSGETGTVLEYTALTGSKYRQITYMDGNVIPWVKLGFSGEVYSIQLKDKYGVIWVIDTFKPCANSGTPVNIITPNFPVRKVPGKPPELIQPPPDAPKYYAPPEREVYIPKYARAEEREIRHEGLLGGPIGKLLYAWLNATKITFNPIILGSKAYAFGGNPSAFGGQGGNGGNPSAFGGNPTAFGGQAGNGGNATSTAAGGDGGNAAATGGDATANGGSASSSSSSSSSADAAATSESH